MPALLRMFLVVTALLLATPPAPAAASASTPAPLRCGRYVNAQNDAALVIDSHNRGRRLATGFDLESLQIERDGNGLVLVNLDDGVATALTASADGRRINDTLQDYQLRAPAVCQPVAVNAAGSCLADANRCMARLHAATPPQLLTACQQGVGAACSGLLLGYVDDALLAAASAKGVALATAAPAPCTTDAEREEVLTCRDARRDALAAAVAQASGQAFARGIDPAWVELPAAQRDQLQQLCLQQRAGRFCTEVAEQQLNARDPRAAVQALQVVCDSGRDSACERVEPLQALGAALRLVDATEPPCGLYRADGGTIDVVAFGDDGHATIGSQRSQVRLLDGAIHLRNDHGSDHVLRLLANGDLLGMDAWTGYQRYQRQPGAVRCEAAPTRDTAPSACR
ncbi:hypothetical protein [Stenotrophomonas indicatrix]|uniref:Uncharacterized protein n=1 Tax=Stenotrophomonas indicatrix TaxID=2045451 RepID=A0ABT8QC24_9GAMM|nr:hypothetical protein [Stenotrophomonas indicatrix]MDN8661911.1 hypothetical protein [Stenotrophomonas indicatrix]MDN8669294.1 hypothetical protein [Stenotrophomonas indicatrix]